MKKRERSVIQLLYYYFHIENLRNFSMFEFHNPIQTQPSYPIVPKNKFKTTIISINFKSAFRVTQHPLNCPERITKFTSRRVEAPLTAIQLSHPPPHTHTQFKTLWWNPRIQNQRKDCPHFTMQHAHPPLSPIGYGSSE